MMLDANAILKINNPFLLFNNTNIKQTYRELATFYHPDKNNDKTSQQVMSNINLMYNNIKKYINDGINIDNLLQIKQFELGTIYIYKDYIEYKIFDNYKHLIKNVNITWNYNSDKMKDQFIHLIPNIRYSKDNIIQINKPTNIYPLSNVLLQKEGSIDDRTVTWIISRLLNLTCFIHYNNISHNGITLDNCFICPEKHTIVLLGGWWYSNKLNQSLSIVNAEVYNNLPNVVKLKKISNAQIDINLIKQLGKKLLKDDMNLLHSNRAPKPLLNWLFSANQNNCIKEFKIWDDVITQSFGERKFVPLEINQQMIYNI